MQNKRKADETAKELRASLPFSASSHASSSRSDFEGQEWLMRSTLSIRWRYVCSVPFGSPKKIITMIRRVITERQNETEAIRRKTGILNDLALITTVV